MPSMGMTHMARVSAPSNYFDIVFVKQLQYRFNFICGVAGIDYLKRQKVMSLNLIPYIFGFKIL